MKIIKWKKNNILIIISLIVICANTISLSRHEEDADFKLNSQIAKPIIELQKDEIIKKQIQENSFPIEYYFYIHNFHEEEINEIAFDYVIEIESSVENFPINYTLFDCDKQKEIQLVDGKSKPLKIKKNVKESKKFKLVLNWKELNFDLADELQIKLRINAEQKKEN